MSDTKPQSETPLMADIPLPPDDLTLPAPSVKPKRTPLQTFKWIGRHFGYRAYRLFGELTAIVLGFALFWVAALNIVMARGHVDVSFLEKNAELWFSEAFNGSDAAIGAMSLDWHPANNAVVFKAEQISITDDNAREIQYVDALTSEVGVGRILFGQLDPRRLHIDGGAVTWKRNENGEITAGLGTPMTVGKLGPVWTGEAAAPKERGVFSLGGLETITIANAVAYVQDNRDGLDLQFSDTFIDVNNIGETFEFKGETQIIIGDEGAPITADLVLSSDFLDFDLALMGKNLNPKSLSPKRGRFSVLNDLDAEAALDIRITSTREEGLSRVDVDLNSGSGTYITDKQDRSFEKAVLKARYDPVDEVLQFTNIDFKSPRLVASGKASLYKIGSPAEGFFKKETDFSLALKDVMIDATSQFDRPFDIGAVNVTGTYDSPNRETEFSKLNVDFGQFRTELNGLVGRTESGALSRLKLKGGINGVLSPEDLLGLWPTEFSLGARNWIDRAILKADLKNFQVDIDIPEDVLKSGDLQNENLSLKFDVANADVKYISTMTPLTNANGVGHLRGNAFDIAATSGQVGAINISQGQVQIPRLHPKGGDLIIDVKGEGGVADIMGLIDQKPYEFASKFGVVPTEFSGQGQLSMNITRPLLEYFDRSRIDYSASGDFSNVSAPFSIGPHKVANGTVHLDLDKSGLHVTGPVNVGPWRADLDWRETFDEGATPSQFKLEGNLGRDDLDGFGIGFREYFSGDVALSVDAIGNGIEILSANIMADLTQAELQAGPHWSKPAGTAGSLTGVFSRTGAGEISFKNMIITAPDMDINGELSLATDLRLINLDLTRAKIGNFIDAAVQIKPDARDDKFSIFVTGKQMDVSPFVASSMQSQSSDMGVPMLMTASLEALTLKPGYVLSNANVLFAHDGLGVSQARLKGTAQAGAFVLDMTTNEAARLREVAIDVPDASHAAKAFFGMDNIEGGHLKIEAGLPLTGDKGPVQGVAKIDAFNLVKAPALAQMLSMASLQGLGDTLGGTGIRFDRFEVPFSMDEGQISIREARVSGPAMGLTGDGDISFADKQLDFDGVLVPAYSANSVLGSIPLIGDLIIGKEGEGMFALTYTVKGTFDKTQVAVNPLSALTPGFLRGIFKSSREDMPDAALVKDIEAVKPPSPDKN